LASEEGRGSRKLSFIKRAIHAVAKEKGYSKFQFYKITTEEIWEKIVDLGHDRVLAKGQIPKLRKKLPKGYYNKYFD